eukprot:TRINITY_DN6554_c0_g1_i1.p1 TRINITY_DN6554_c0_g1~~TRINITY_DN6554_c0_g1_i1.p1  ORF type:complete len:742 (-),score=298.00 TRINITY_DN6554_c0_g1_i1:185-2356(-)
MEEVSSEELPPSLISSWFPNKEKKNAITPNKIIMVCLIRVWLQPECESRRSFAVFLHKMIKDESSKNVSDLMKEFKSCYPSQHVNQVLDLLQQQMSEMNTIDDLYDFLERLIGLFSDEEEEQEEMQSSPPFPLGWKTSIGIFVRKMRLAFLKMNFDDFSSLFYDLNRQFEEYLNPSEEEMIKEENLREGKRGEENEKKRFERYLDCLKRREYEGAIDAVHSYFDYCLGDKGQKSLLSYSVLNLAIIHYHFGHMEESTQAIHETIRIAQDRNDKECLAYCLSWLSQISEFSSKESRSQHHEYRQYLLQKIISTTKKLEMSDLASVNYMALTKYNLEHLDLFSQTLNEISEMTQLNNGVKSMDAQSFQKRRQADNLVKATVWDILGDKHLTSLHSQLQLQSVDSSPANGDLTCLAYCKLAQNAVDNGEYNKSNQLLERGGKAIHQDFIARDKWLQVVNSIHFFKFLRSGEIYAAELVCNEYASLVSSPFVPSIDISSIFHSIHIKIALHMHCNRFDTALSMAEDLLERSRTERLFNLQASTLIYIAEIHMKSEQFVKAVPHLLSCVSICETHLLSSLLAWSIILLAEVYLELDKFSLANSLLQSNSLRSSIHCSPLVIQGFFYQVKAMCLIMEGTKNSMESSLGLLSQSIKIFDKVEYLDKSIDTIYLRVKVLDELDKTKERDEAIKKLEDFDSLRRKRYSNTSNYFSIYQKLIQSQNYRSIQVL